jgi:hypothetical protein
MDADSVHPDRSSIGVSQAIPVLAIHWTDASNTGRFSVENGNQKPTIKRIER